MVVRLFFCCLIVATGVDAAAINSSEAIEIGGIKQWIKLDGVDDQAPVLLFLHGGPGNSVMSYSDRFTAELKKNFVLALWDQRASGQTAELNKSSQPLTVSLFVSDAIEVIEYLRNKFSKTKIYLVGHSWGGYLGMRVAIEKPELLAGYFALSPMINQLESERLSLQTMHDSAIKTNNLKQLAELSQIKIPFENGDQLFYHRKWLSKKMGSTSPTKTKVDSWAKTWLAVFNEASKTNFIASAPEIKCPIYLLIGSNDYQTYYKLAETYYEQVICTGKNLYWFTHSAHNPHLTESEKFQEIIISMLNKN
jgi:pimeloyl-ACP methyl ester carboxylesterase